MTPIDLRSPRSAIVVMVAFLVGACVPVVPTTMAPPTRSPTIDVPPSATSLPPVSTLTRPQREARVKDLLETNGRCALPCWWGIQPGTTSATDVDSLFLSMGAKILVDGESVPPGTHQVGGLDVAENLIQTEFSFMESGGIVQSIAVHGLANQEPVGFREAWNTYSPQNVLSLLGAPSRIWINSARSGAPRETYGLWLFYDEKGVLVQYTGLADKDEFLHICPTFHEPSTISSIQIILQGPMESGLLEDLLPYTLDPRYFRDIQIATGLSVADAVEAMLDEESPCFDTPREIWPF